MMTFRCKTACQMEGKARILALSGHRHLLMAQLVVSIAIS